MTKRQALHNILMGLSKPGWVFCGNSLRHAIPTTTSRSLPELPRGAWACPISFPSKMDARDYRQTREGEAIRAEISDVIILAADTNRKDRPDLLNPATLLRKVMLRLAGLR